MIAAFDVQYFDGFAKVVGMVFQRWEDEFPYRLLEKIISPVEEYIPGAFFKREMPCVLGLLEDMSSYDITCIVIDGYVHLDNEGKAGLGLHLWNALGQEIPVVGVAKRSFHQNVNLVKQVLRGNSSKPLFVTAVGIQLDVAADNITHMHGEFRMPTLLKIVDQHTKYPELTSNT